MDHKFFDGLKLNLCGSDFYKFLSDKYGFFGPLK